jgi:hypothetical protein
MNWIRAARFAALSAAEAIVIRRSSTRSLEAAAASATSSRSGLRLLTAPPSTVSPIVANINDLRGRFRMVLLEHGGRA